MARIERDAVLKTFIKRLGKASTPEHISALLSELRGSGFSDPELVRVGGDEFGIAGFEYNGQRFMRQKGQTKPARATPSSRPRELAIALRAKADVIAQDDRLRHHFWSDALGVKTVSAGNLAAALKGKNAQAGAAEVRRSLTCARALLHFDAWNGEWRLFQDQQGPISRASAALSEPLSPRYKPVAKKPEADAWSIQPGQHDHIARLRGTPFVSRTEGVPITYQNALVAEVTRDVSLVHDRYFLIDPEVVDLFPVKGKADEDGYIPVSEPVGRDLHEALEGSVQDLMVPLAGALSVGQVVTLTKEL